jgi:hypothetical protein
MCNKLIQKIIYLFKVNSKIKLIIKINQQFLFLRKNWIWNKFNANNFFSHSKIAKYNNLNAK